MNLRHLRRWQQNALAEALWGLHDGSRDWERIEPKLPRTNSGVGNDGDNDMKARAMSRRADRPQLLIVRVPALPALGIPRHYISLSRRSYEEALSLMRGKCRDAYQDYVQNVYLSAVYQFESVTRVRVNKDGSTAKRHTSYIGRAEGKSDELLVVLEGLFDLTDAPTAGELRETLHREWGMFVKRAGLALATDDAAKLEGLLEDYQDERDVLVMLTQADLPELSGEVAEAVTAMEQAAQAAVAM